MKISKINQQLIEANDRLTEIAEYDANTDFDTRSGYICANIKVYEWLDSSDLDQIIKENNLEPHRQDLEEEFNETRLNNIINHVCETEVSLLKEMYEGLCHLENYTKHREAYAFYYKNDYYPLSYSFYFKRYEKVFSKFFKRKRNTPKDYWNWLYKNNKQQIDERYALENIKRECWQFGRSGGWFSLCKIDELENFEPFNDLCINDSMTNHEINEEINNYHLTYNQTKRELLQDLQHEIKEWEEKKSDIASLITDIEESKSGFKSTLIHQLENEVNQFISEQTVSESNVTINISDDKVVTSLGVSVPLNDFQKKLKELLPSFKTLKEDERLSIKERVGSYFVEYAKKVENDILVKAGCHRFSLNQILKTINQ